MHVLIKSIHLEKANAMTLLVILKAKSLQIEVHITNLSPRPLICRKATQLHQSAIAPRILTL